MCSFYGYTKQTNIHGIVQKKSEKKNKLNLIQKPLNCIKVTKPTAFPPFRKWIALPVLIKHITKSSFIVTLYKVVAQTFSLNGLTIIDYG